MANSSRRLMMPNITGMALLKMKVNRNLIEANSPTTIPNKAITKENKSIAPATITNTFATFKAIHIAFGNIWRNLSVNCSKKKPCVFTAFAFTKILNLVFEAMKPLAEGFF